MNKKEFEKVVKQIKESRTKQLVITVHPISTLKKTLRGELRKELIEGSEIHGIREENWILYCEGKELNGHYSNTFNSFQLNGEKAYFLPREVIKSITIKEGD